jgi:hypothetical protein
MIATTMGWPLVRVAAMAAAAGLVGVAPFQPALALGGATGASRLGWYPRGPPRTELRIASGVAVLVWTCAALVVLLEAGWD